MMSPTGMTVSAEPDSKTLTPSGVWRRIFPPDVAFGKTLNWTW
jgi:hypothetical protein